jgi:hypothetical protein
MSQEQDNATDANCEMDNYPEDPHPVFRAIGCGIVLWVVAAVAVALVVGGARLLAR